MLSHSLKSHWLCGLLPWIGLNKTPSCVLCVFSIICLQSRHTVWQSMLWFFVWLHHSAYCCVQLGSLQAPSLVCCFLYFLISPSYTSWILAILQCLWFCPSLLWPFQGSAVDSWLKSWSTLTAHGIRATGRGGAGGQSMVQYALWNCGISVVHKVLFICYLFSFSVFLHELALSELQSSPRMQHVSTPPSQLQLLISHFLLLFHCWCTVSVRETLIFKVK